MSKYTTLTGNYERPVKNESAPLKIPALPIDIFGNIGVDS
jgi:hypothetical protein